MRPHKRLIRLKKYTKVYLQKNANVAAAAKELKMSPAGLNKALVSVEGQAVLSKMAQELNKVGVTDEFLAKSIKKGMKAKKTTYFQNFGVVTAKRRDVDHNARHKYTETALKLKRHLSDAPPVEGAVHLHFSKVDINAPIGEKILGFANSLSQNTGR